MRALRASLAVLLLLASACERELPPPPADTGTFPYHPLVYTLDLAILAYQLHCQSLVWPIDPFYEERATTTRPVLINSIRAWAARRGAAQVLAKPGLAAFRGPGVLSGVENNPTHDPIIYDYSRLHPWSEALMNASGTWTEYLTPRELTRRIRDVWVSARVVGGNGEVELYPVPVQREDRDADATDVLLAFEGGTGDKGEAGQPSSYSLMGFVLLRETGGGSYDVHVAFRGSRSGSAERAIGQALSTESAEGNPDWITDLGWLNVNAAAGAGDITTVGGVSRGFARSMKSILPGLFQCLSKVAELKQGVAPTNVFVTGHSLGGGLAQHFVSAVMLGDEYGPDAAGPAMPEALRAWPWKTLKLVTYSAPLAGDYTWAERMTHEVLQAELFDPGPVASSDGAGLIAIDPNVLSRLKDTTRPAGFRVLISTDPITTTKVGGGGNHVGTTVYANGDGFIDWIGPPNFENHEPLMVRLFLTERFQDARIPPTAWRYRQLTELAPKWDDTKKSERSELEKLAAGLRAYYRDADAYFDDAAFDRDLALMFAIEDGTAP